MENKILPKKFAWKGDMLVIQRTNEEKFNAKDRLEVLRGIEQQKQKLMQQMNQAQAQISQLEQQYEQYSKEVSSIETQLRKKEEVDKARVEAAVKIKLDEFKKELVQEAFENTKRTDWQEDKNYLYTVYHNAVGRACQKKELQEVCPQFIIREIVEKYLTKKDIEDHNHNTRNKAEQQEQSVG